MRLVDDPFGRFALAECRILNGGPVQIDSVLGLQRSVPNESAQLWLFRGRIEETTGQIDRAVDSFARAVTLRPEGREAHFRLGQLLKRLGNAEGAQSQLALASQIEQKRKAVRREHQRLRTRVYPTMLSFSCVSGNCAPMRDWSRSPTPGMNDRSARTIPGASPSSAGSLQGRSGSMADRWLTLGWPRIGTTSVAFRHPARCLSQRRPARPDGASWRRHLLPPL